jgi:hypothetical protein
MIDLLEGLIEVLVIALSLIAPPLSFLSDRLVGHQYASNVIKKNLQPSELETSAPRGTERAAAGIYFGPR